MPEPRIQLRPYAEADREFFTSIVSDPRTMSRMGGAKTAPEADELFDRILAASPERGLLAWAVVDPEGSPVGHAFLSNLRPGVEVEIGFALLPSAWGRGLGTEVARSLVELARDDFSCTRVLATVDVDHVASRRVLEKAGMSLVAEKTDDEGPYHVFEWRAV
ncbi:MAG: GNAT family N-acetyltransferase [Planctomycetota bacterium]|jgi:RimJ/RimL family protein N-acetyltransferase